MNPERWRQIRNVFDQVVLLQTPERSSSLDSLCGGDAELRREVESLLHSDHQAGTGFLNTPAANLSSPRKSPSRIGSRIGAYVVLDEIGRGGMGEVYRAARADGQFEKEVAIKFVRGGYNSASVIDRFRHERQILASLDHPNIGQLLDGGTTDDGIPYLLMELIEGIPIDQYCEKHSLNITERLRLFLQVCSAVQYAHQRLVIHRDIKPGNILVTKSGVPKLLDFGIAKILDSSDTAQHTIAAPMTPEYASPEQILGQPVTTSTDLYSLGVVLFILLTGNSPHPITTNSQFELARAICDKEPQPPSAVVAASFTPESPTKAASTSFLPEGTATRLQRRLRGDLDNIVLRALQKDPQRRYHSVEQFAEDLRRHLDGLPVIARRDSLRYRAEKFALRHKVVVSASLLIFLAVAGGVTATLWEARIAAANGRRAEQRFNDVRKLANSLMFEIHDAIRDLPGSTSARRLLVSRAQQYLDNLNQQSKGDISLQKELAAAYERVGDVLGYPYAANLGDKDGALENYRKALALRESLLRITPKDRSLQADLADTYFRMASVAESTGKFSEALAALAKAEPITQALAIDSNDPASADRYAGAYYFTAQIQVETGEVATALQNYQRAAMIRDAALERSPGNFALRTHLAADYDGIAKCFHLTHDLPHAIEVQSKAVLLLQELADASPDSATLAEYLGEGTNELAGYKDESGQPAAGLESFRKAHAIFARLLSTDPKNTLAKSNFGFSDNGMGKTLIALGKPAAALTIFRESVASFEQMSPETTSSRYVRTGLAQAYAGLGDAYAALATSAVSKAQQREYWDQSRSSCAKSLSVWKDKQKRSELESGERDGISAASRCVARAEAKLPH